MASHLRLGFLAHRRLYEKGGLSGLIIQGRMGATSGAVQSNGKVLKSWATQQCRCANGHIAESNLPWWKGIYDVAIEELAREESSLTGWYVFPQLKGLGRSSTSDFYGVAGLVEARTYLAHPVLGDRLLNAIRTLLTHRNLKAEQILGDLDALKFRSCLTLFSLAAPSEKIFIDALETFFGGVHDARANKLLAD